MGCSISNPVLPSPMSDQSKLQGKPQEQAQGLSEFQGLNGSDVKDKVGPGPFVLTGAISGDGKKVTREEQLKAPKVEINPVHEEHKDEPSRHSNFQMSVVNRGEDVKLETHKSVLKVNNRKSKLNFTLNNSNDISGIDDVTPGSKAKNFSKNSLKPNQNLLVGDLLMDSLKEAEEADPKGRRGVTWDNSGNFDRIYQEALKNRMRNVSMKDRSQGEMNISILKEKLRNRRGDQVIDTSVYDSMLREDSKDLKKKKKKDQPDNCIDEANSLQSSIFSSSCKSGILNEITPQRLKGKSPDKNKKDK
jgi:hypothetical protein